MEPSAPIRGLTKHKTKSGRERVFSASLLGGRGFSIWEGVGRTKAFQGGLEDVINVKHTHGSLVNTENQKNTPALLAGKGGERDLSLIGIRKASPLNN